MCLYCGERYQVMIDHRSFTHGIPAGLNFFQAYNFISFSAGQKYDLSCIHLPFLAFYGYITNPQCDHLPDALIAHLVDHCTSIAEAISFRSEIL